MDQYHDIFGVFSRLLPALRTPVHHRQTCASVPARAGGQAGGHGQGQRWWSRTALVQHVVRSLGLEDVRPVPAAAVPGAHQPPVQALHPQRARAGAHRHPTSLGTARACCPSSSMTLYEQIREFRRANVLAGIHGSGLTNFMFLHGSDKATQRTSSNVRPAAHALEGRRRAARSSAASRADAGATL